MSITTNPTAQMLLDVTAGRLYAATLAVEAIGTALKNEGGPNIDPLVVHGLGEALIIIAQGPLTECREAIEPDQIDTGTDKA
jgi:hypothetical protein